MRLRHVVVPLALAAGCALPDYDALTGGGPSASPEGGTPGADAGGEGGAVDGGADSADGAPSSTTLRCSDKPMALLCTDFEAIPYDLGLVHMGGTTTSTTSSFVSPSHALVASLPARATSARPTAFLQKALSPSLLSFTLSWSAKVVSTGTQDAVDIGGFYRDSTFYALIVRYRRNASGEKVEVYEFGNGTPSANNFIALPVTYKSGEFNRYELQITASASASSLTALVNGAVAASNVPLTAHLYTSNLFVTMGIPSSDGLGAPVDVIVDDVLVEQK